MKKIIISALLVISLGVTVRGQTKSLNIQLDTGTTKSVTLNKLSKITFSDTDLILVYEDQSTENILKKSIRLITFSDVTGVSDIFFLGEKFSIYPNPATNYITLGNLSDGENEIAIYSVSGNCVMAFEAKGSTQTIDVSALDKGMYLLKLNSEVFKFTKL